jgi:Lrp/AsnC family transcriptional regulator for asnA, asnC and gidA
MTTTARRPMTPVTVPSLPEPPEPADGDYLGAALRLVHRQFDDLDLQILGLLRVDGRMATREMARRCGVPEGQVRRRLGRLLDQEAIRVTVLTEPSSVGLLLNAFVFIKCRMDSVQPIIAALSAAPEVRYVAFVTGSFDLVIEAFFYSRKHLSAFLTERLAGLDGLIASETSIVLEIGKLSYEWEVPEPATTAVPD